MVLHIMNIAGTNAIVQSLIMAFYFGFTKKGPRTSNKILAALLVSFAILIFGVLPYGTWTFSHLWKMGHCGIRFDFLIAPLFYFYIKSLLDEKFRFKRIYIIHLLPFALTFIAAVFEIFFIQDWDAWRGLVFLYRSPIILIQNLLYISLAFSFIKSKGFSVKSFFTSVNDSQIAWLRFFIVGYIFIWLIIFKNFMLLQIFHLFFWCPFGGSLLCLIPFIFFNIITIIALIKPDMIFKPFRNGNPALSESFMKRYRERLIKFIEEEKPYRDASLTLVTLAQQLSIPVAYLSKIINESFNLNFNEFINSYRIKESQALLLNQSNGKKNILEIAYEVGFNSKTTFNSAFKKFTGFTPREFKKSYRMKINPN